MENRLSKLFRFLSGRRTTTKMKSIFSLHHFFHINKKLFIWITKTFFFQFWQPTYREFISINKRLIHSFWKWCFDEFTPYTKTFNGKWYAPTSSPLFYALIKNFLFLYLFLNNPTYLCFWVSIIPIFRLFYI